MTRVQDESLGCGDVTRCYSQGVHGSVVSCGVGCRFVRRYAVSRKYGPPSPESGGGRFPALVRVGSPGAECVLVLDV